MSILFSEIFSESVSLLCYSTFINSTFLNIVSSGQARLVRATTEGGSGIHIIHGMSSSDSDDDEDFDEDFAYHNGKAASPPGIVDP